LMDAPSVPATAFVAPATSISYVGLPETTPGTNTATDRGSGPAGAFAQDTMVDKTHTIVMKRFNSDSPRCRAVHVVDQ